MKTAVIGAGAWGTALAKVAHSNGGDVCLWGRDADALAALGREGRNERYLPGVELPRDLPTEADLVKAVDGAGCVVLAVPSRAFREVIARLAKFDGVAVSVTKGIEFETGLTMHGILEDVLDAAHHPRLVALSGPSFAAEIAQQRPTVVTLACREEAYAISVQATLSSPWFRCYTNSDVVGVEIAGALKNVIAIAIGMCDAQDGGHNARAALMTRGLAEITRIGVALGATPETFLGLSGMGDLLLTCTGDLSRNRRVGLGLGSGRKLEEIVADLGEVAEGVQTTRAAVRLAGRLGVEAPISSQVRAVLDGEKTPQEAGLALMTRQLKSERDTSFARRSGTRSPESEHDRK